MIVSGSSAISTVVPSSSVRVSGKAAASEAGADAGGVPVAAGAIELVASGGIVGAWVAPPPHAARTTAIRPGRMGEASRLDRRWVGRRVHANLHAKQ